MIVGLSEFRRRGRCVFASSVLLLSACGSDVSSEPPVPIVQASPTPTPTPTATPTAFAANCTALLGKVVGGATITAVTRVEANVVANAAGLCSVKATRAPFLDMEVDLPDNWSGRLLQQGGSGFDGSIPSALTINASGAVTSINKAVIDKAAVYAASNGGNRANVPAQAGPAVWANGTPDGQSSADDYAYNAIGTTVAFAKALIGTFYGRAPSFTYFNGCSNGGRNAYIAAQRWPREYDGIVSGCETMDMGGQTAAWLKLGSTAGTPAAIGAAQFTAAFNAALTDCDGNDGVVDGVLANPKSCALTPAMLRCGEAKANPDPALCLSDRQVATLSSLLGDVRLSNGTLVYSGYSWANFSSFGPSFGGLGGGFALLATKDASWLTGARQNAYNLDTDYSLISNGLLRAGADHDRAAIASYIASGRKLISWHSNTDNLLSPNDHLRNYATMIGLAQRMGLSDPRQNTRFFLVPGAQHGAGGAFIQVDWFDAIVKWVESNQAPTQLTYNFSISGEQRSLPVCEAPKYPRYTGTGARTDASSFICTDPAQ